MSFPGRLPPAPARVPAYAWAWLQRSRPIVAEIGSQLYGDAAGASVVERLQGEYPQDPFVQDVVARIVCDVAFGGRVLPHRPGGVNWDRGLVWWAARLAGVGVREFEARSQPPQLRQVPLFGPEGSGAAEEAPSPPPPPPSRPPSAERTALAGALRELLSSGDGTQVPAAAVRQLIAQLES